MDGDRPDKKTRRYLERVVRAGGKKEIREDRECQGTEDMRNELDFDAVLYCHYYGMCPLCQDD